MDSKEINVTYETLYELLRRERSREELQELSDSFFADVIDYIESKKKLLKDQGMAEQKQKIQKQLDNIHKLIRELYDKRERKIIQMGLTKARTGSDIIDTARLLGNEKQLYDEILAVCSKYRKEILDSILNSKKVESKAAPIKQNTVVRFKQPVPKFIGKELETYGPFDTDDIASLPAEISSVLVKKGRAEEMDE